VKWIPQGFDWVDPLKDQQAQQMAVRNGFKSRSEVISELGYDAEEIDQEIAADNNRAEAESGFVDRLSTEFSSSRLEIVSAGKQWPADSLGWAKKCYYLTNDPYNTVLIDSTGAIRGYYDVRLRDEEDRLRVELKILLKQY
jgi:hypothetical protein